MTEQVFASVWGLSYAHFEFLSLYKAQSRVMVACQLLFGRLYGRIRKGRSELDPDVIEYVTDQIGIADDPADFFSSDTARRQRGDILDFFRSRRASERDRIELQSWMVAHIGGRNLLLFSWISPGYEQALRMGVFVPSDKVMERLARAARRNFRDDFLTLAASRLPSETARQLELVLSEPLAETGFQRPKDDLGAASLVSILLATRKVSFNEGLDLPLEALAAVNRGCPPTIIAASPRSSTSTSTRMACLRSIWKSGSILNPWPHRGIHGEERTPGPAFENHPCACRPRTLA